MCSFLFTMVSFVKAKSVQVMRLSLSDCYCCFEIENLSVVHFVHQELCIKGAAPKL